MKTVKPINLSQLANPNNDVVINRLDYIFTTIFNTCGSKLNNWYIEDAKEGSIGNVREVIRRDYISMSGIEYDAVKVNYKDFIAILDGEEWDLLDVIPLYWFEEDFENELKEGLAAYKNKLQKKKAAEALKRATNKQLKEALIQSARAKLTPEEQKAVGIYGK